MFRHLKNAKQGDKLEIILAQNEVCNLTTGKTLPMKPIPAFRQELLEAGGPMSYLKAQHARKYFL